MTTGSSADPEPAPRDRFDRPLRDLRLSVTDRCNFRCRYCMPRDEFGPDHEFLPRSEILTFEENARLVRIFRRLGVRKVRITGGEPMLRNELSKLVAMLSEIGEMELAMTTNGTRLVPEAAALARAGLDRVTVSLDSLDDEVFRRMSDADVPVSRVLDGIEAAADAGLSPIKINAVVRRGVNDDSVLELARRFKGTGHVVRFIEYMDVGTANDWRMEEVVPGREIVERIDAEMPLEPVEAAYRGEVARRWRYVDGEGEIGVITSVTQPFCSDCTRARLSAQGTLYTCLFATDGLDLREPLRDGADDSEIESLIRRLWHRRVDRASELRSESSRKVPGSRSGRIEMSYIGG